MKTAAAILCLAIVVTDPHSTSKQKWERKDYLTQHCGSDSSIEATYFREDVNADGVINSADVALVQSESGTALP
jgi:hypothetical protein